MSDEEVVDPNTIQLNVTKVLAAILKKYGALEIPSLDLLEDYDNMELAISMHDESNTMVFELVEKVATNES